MAGASHAVPAGTVDQEAEGYVAVRDEPRHRRRFENEHVRVYDVLVPPGDTTRYHRHDEDTFYVAVDEATVRDRTWGETDARTGTAPAGSCLCRPHRDRPLIHQVTNVGSGPMRLIGAEIRTGPVRPDAAPLSAPGHTLSLERDRLRVYDLELGPGATTGEIDYGFASLTVFLTVATLRLVRADGEETRIHAPGDVVWHPGPQRMALVNAGEESFRAVVGEWR